MNKKSTARAGGRAPLPNDRGAHPATPRRPRKRNRLGNRKFGYVVKEAKRDLVVPLLQFDVEKAAEEKPKNVNNKDNFLSCVIAQAVTRACGAERVWIGRKTAYVAFPGDKCTRRYEVSNKSRAILEAWDKGEDVEEGVELVLKAPSKQRTRASMRKHWQENKQNYRSDTRRKQRRSDPLHNVVRNGNLVRWS